MIPKDLNKKNFILWYSLYASQKELEMVRASNREALHRLLKEYAEEVDRVDKTKRLYERIVQPQSIRTQGFDGVLRIDYFFDREKNNSV
ncbi:MAG: hypothetical protein FJ264_06525 [Planctomycetes bacterium]|nr:hypothetical protein [Planctomycetota bacterium]